MLYDRVEVQANIHNQEITNSSDFEDNNANIKVPAVPKYCKRLQSSMDQRLIVQRYYEQGFTLSFSLRCGEQDGQLGFG